MTRCKVGDLAIVVKSLDFPENLGLIVRVVRPHPYSPEAWIVDPDGARPGYEGYWDCCLLPINDPGPDAVDEMVEKLGKPSEVMA